MGSFRLEELEGLEGLEGLVLEEIEGGRDRAGLALEGIEGLTRWMVLKKENDGELWGMNGARIRSFT